MAHGFVLSRSEPSTYCCSTHLIPRILATLPVDHFESPVDQLT
jgi:hypothetical protein